MRVPFSYSGEFQITDNIIDLSAVFAHRLYQRCRGIKQLGQTSLVLFGADHSRMEHHFGVTALAKQIAPEWYRRGWIDAPAIPILCMGSFIHDIGHGPFSHALEPLLAMNHHENGIRILEKLRHEIGACGVSVEALIRCLNDEYPLFAAVAHGLLGWDKLDYMLRDAGHTHMGGMPEIMFVLAHTRPFEGRIVLEKTAVAEALQLVSFMFNMYARIYERSKCAYARRLVQKLYEQMRRLELIAENELMEMTDLEFEARAMSGNDPDLTYLQDTFHGHHPLPRTGLLVCQTGFGRYYERSAKTMRRIVELDPAAFAALDAKVQWRNAAEQETRCAAIAVCETKHVFIQPSRNPRRYTLPKTTILDGNRTFDLSEITDTSIYDKLAQRIRLIRVGTNDEDALCRIYDRSDAILKVLQE